MILAYLDLRHMVLLQQLALTLGWMHHADMNAYSEDLRKKIVEAKERGMPTVEVARTFGVGLSSVKRYAKTVREGESLSPKSTPGRPPKADESARRLLEADLEERPAATLTQRCEYLRSAVGLRVRACANRERSLVKRARIARSFGELSKLPCEGANPCPHSKHTSSSPSGNSSPRYCPKES